jgi:mycoredoxin-dependent peroxiredoxin
MRGTIVFRMPEKNVRGVDTSEPAGVGTIAPDFELPALIAGVKKTLRLSSYRGTAVVLAFYPYNWREESAKQLISFQVQRPRLLASHAEIVAVTVDSIMNTTTWEREIGPFDFPICADFWPHGEACMRYGVLRDSGPDAGSSELAVFVIDCEGRVVFRKIYGRDQVPTLEDVFPMLEKL